MHDAYIAPSEDVHHAMSLEASRTEVKLDRKRNQVVDDVLEVWDFLTFL
jgi:hypothetical protein